MVKMGLERVSYVEGIEVGHQVEVTAGPHSWISKVEAITDSEIVLTPPAGIVLKIGEVLQLASLTGDFLNRYASRVVQLFPKLVIDPPVFEEAHHPRAFVRVPDQLPLTVIFQDEGVPQSAQTETADLSAGGVGFSFQNPLSGRLTLILALPGAAAGKTDQLRLAGQVRRNVPLGSRFHVGVEWLDLSDHEQDMLTQYIFRRMRALFRRS